MERGISIRNAQAVLRQRNALLFFVIGLMALNAWTWLELNRQEEQIVLIPVLDSETRITNRRVTAHYLEQVTRDVVTLMLNRNPRSLPYFEDELLRIVHPSAYGEVKKQFVKMVDEARSGDISTVFFPTRMTVDPSALRSEIEGELHVYVGNTRVSKDRRVYEIRWHYAGLRLSLIAFEDILNKEASQ